MEKGQDLIKYITQRVVTYIDTPVEARREHRLERISRTKEPWPTKWFGMVPLSVQMWAGKWKRAGQPLLRQAARLKLVRWRKGPRPPQDEKAHS